jgi:hypothetical protein
MQELWGGRSKGTEPRRTQRETLDFPAVVFEGGTGERLREILIKVKKTEQQVSRLRKIARKQAILLRSK